MVHLLLLLAVALPAAALWTTLKVAKRLAACTLTLLVFLSGVLLIAPLVVVLGGDWVSTVYRGSSKLLGLALHLAPLAAAAVLYQWIIYRTAGGDRPADHFTKYLWARARIGILGAVPLVLMLLVLVTALRLFPELELAGATLAALAAAALSVAFSVYPYLFKWLMGGHKLSDADLRARLFGLAGKAGVQVSDIVVLPSKGAQTLNAWVSGIWPKHRIVFLTEGLITSLTGPEVEAVFAHELGHLRKQHLLAYLLYAISVTVLFAYAGVALSGILPSHPALVPIRGVTIGVMSLSGYAFLSRRFGLSADRYSVALTQNAAAVAGALEKLAKARGLKGRNDGLGLMAVFQTHPPLAERMRGIRG